MSSPLPRAADPSLQELESTLGVLFIGFLVCIILYGFTFFRSCSFYAGHSKQTCHLVFRDLSLFFAISERQCLDQTDGERWNHSEPVHLLMLCLQAGILW